VILLHVPMGITVQFLHLQKPEVEMPPIVNYFVVTNRRIDKLEEKVKELLAKGWQPLGGISAGVDGAYQAMVLYKG